MRRLVLFLLCLLLPFAAQAATDTVSGVTAPAKVAGVSSANIGKVMGVTFSSNECDSLGYLVCQNFEGTGYDNSESWTESVPTGATVNEDYTTTVLRGSQSLYVNKGTSADGYTEVSYTSTGTTYGHAIIRMSYMTGAVKVVQIYNGTTEIGSIAMQSNVGLILTSGSATCDTVSLPSVNTTYHVYWTISSAGTASANFSTTRTPGTGNNACSISSGGTTSASTKIRIVAPAMSGNVIADQVYVDNASLGTVAE